MCSKMNIPFKSLSETKTCPVCSDNSVEYASSYPSEVEPFASSTIEYCTACGLGYVVDADVLLDNFYSVQYSRSNRGDRQIEPEQYFSPEMRSKSPRLSRYFARANRQLSVLESLRNPLKHILDFGSGPGYFLSISQAKTLAAFEPDLDSQKYLSHIGATRYENLDDLPRGSFDAIISSHSMEHLVAERLVKTLTVLFSCLKANGSLLIEVPQGGISHLVLNYRHDPHTIFFTQESLTKAIQAAGGELIFSKCFATKSSNRRSDAIYDPKGSKFIRSRSGSVTIVARRKPGFAGRVGQKFDRLTRGL